MTISVDSQEFDGPFPLSTAHLRLESRSGVYVILTLDHLGRYEVVDVGESEDVRHRVCNSHERESCWMLNNKQGLYVAALYCSERERMVIERSIRQTFQPACGVR